ncbi:hypothetical protein LPJ53_005825 [Coemansia erecta]|uniref:Thioredoxin domain-containing protein n=1 Tax=Coemansia erecta TaxID=147472 RepID=A0A9W7XVZ5_9FUNG|nr:hypothetical protein LPJ53_005825 [Coemansia erecta]
MKCVRVGSPDRFDELVKKALSGSDAVFVLFFGREDPGTNLSWCSDCVVADPKVRRAIGAVDGSVLLEVPVDRKSDIGSPSNVYRTRKDTKVERVPTLLRWTPSGPSDTRLVEDECTEALIKEYVVKTSP